MAHRGPGRPAASLCAGRGNRLTGPRMLADRALLMIIVGGDALALSTARELSLLQGRRIVVLWPADLEFASAVEAVGAQFIAGRPDSRAGLEMAGVSDAVTILALSHNTRLILRPPLRAREPNPPIPPVLRHSTPPLSPTTSET